MVRLVLVFAVLSSGAASPAFAQTPPVSPSWQVSLGPGWVSIRDVARTGRPVDASPLRWRSNGPAVEAARQWGGTGRHRVTLAAVRAARFEYRSPLGPAGARGDDRYQEAEVRYEYRRWLRRDAARHLDVVIGGQTLASLTSWRRVVPVDLVTSERIIGSGLALALGAEWHPGRVSAGVHWVNGMRFVRHREDNDVQATPSSRWGGGWLTDVRASISWRVAAGTAVAVEYVRSGDALLSNHRTLARSHGAVTVGVRHAR